MKRMCVSLLGVFISLSSTPCFATEGWLLIFRNGHHSLVHATAEAFRPVAQVGNRTSFGSSAEKIGLVSRDMRTGMGVFVVVDKATKSIDGSWQLNVNPVVQLGGPSASLIFQERFAYFADLRATPDGQSTEPNSLGGSFDLVRVSIADGTTERIPLPRDCLDPRIATQNGVVFVYTWNGASLWRFDNSSKSLEKVVLKSDVDIIGESASDTGGGRFADYVSVPHLGVYRLSRSGTLKRFLDQRLALAVEHGQIGKTQIEGQVIRVFPATLGGSQNIGVLRKDSRRTQVLYVDPRSGKVNWEAELESEVEPNSVVSLPDGSLVYTDSTRNAIRKVTPAGETIELWNLAKEAPNSWSSQARFIN